MFCVGMLTSDMTMDQKQQRSENSSFQETVCTASAMLMWLMCEGFGDWCNSGCVPIHVVHVRICVVLVSGCDAADVGKSRASATHMLNWPLFKITIDVRHFILGACTSDRRSFWRTRESLPPMLVLYCSNLSSDRGQRHMVSKRDLHLHLGHAQVVPHKMGRVCCKHCIFNVSVVRQAIMGHRGYICEVKCRRVYVRGQ